MKSTAMHTLHNKLLEYVGHYLRVVMFYLVNSVATMRNFTKFKFFTALQ